MNANYFYNEAIQAYRCIPTKHRAKYAIENKLSALRTKITDTGRASLDEMTLLKTNSINGTDLVNISISFVTGKQSPKESLLYFSRLYQGPDLAKITKFARESILKNPLSVLGESIQKSHDGRTIAKTPSANFNTDENDPVNQAILNQQIHEHFTQEVRLIARTQLIPALGQILMEHRITKNLLEEICILSPIVPLERQKLVSFALWLGFEYEFGHAIHLLCPQLENIVRTKLKGYDISTTNIDSNGIEQENGLSSLMDLPEATQILGENLTFEIKSIFTESQGFNLRNETAHGLLDDNASLSISSVYAWWMILRLIIHSIMRESPYRQQMLK